MEDDLEEISSLVFSQQTTISSTSQGEADITEYITKYAYVVSDKRQMSLKVLKLEDNNLNYLNDTMNGNGIVVATYNLFPNETPTIGDWEDISLGPCTDVETSQYNVDDICIYIGDIGNTGGQNRNFLSIYKFKEPIFDPTIGPTDLNITDFVTIDFTYSTPFDQSADKYYNCKCLLCALSAKIATESLPFCLH